MTETIADIEQMIKGNKKSYVVAINVDVVMKIEDDSYLKKVVDDADMVLVDGKPLVWISKLHGKPLKEKISGSDLVPLLCEVAAEKDIRFLLLVVRMVLQNRPNRNLKLNIPILELLEPMHHHLSLKKTMAN